MGSIAYGNGMFVSVNYQSSSIIYSYDAVTWFTVNLENVANWELDNIWQKISL